MLSVPVVATLALALGACVTVQTPPLPKVPLPAHWRNAPQLGAKPDLTGWWKHFHDPQLNALVQRALHDNPDVQQAVWRLRAARASEEAEGSQFRPQVAVNTNELSNAANTASFFQAGFDASWEIGLFGLKGASGRIASAKTGAAEADLQSARVSLVAEVVREYLSLRAAQREEALLHQVSAADAEKVKLLRSGEHLWLASERDVQQASAASAMAAAKVSDPRAAVAKAAQALALLLGQSEPDPAWLKPAPLPRLEDADVNALPANLLRTRPDIRYAETQVVQAAGELGVATANLYPSLTIGGGLTSSSRILGHDHLGTANTIFGLAPIIHIPLFDWGQVKAQRNARADLLQASLAAYRKAVLAGAAQVETSLADLDAADRRLTHVNHAVAASRKVAEMSQHYLALGETDRMNHIDAELAVTQSQLARVGARLQYGVAFVALYKALGGAPLPPGAGSGSGAAAVPAHSGHAGR